MKKTLAVSLVALSTLLAGGNALADAKADRLVKQRQAVMILQSKYFGPMGNMAKGKMAYNAEIVKRNTAYIDALSQMAWDGFNPSTKDSKSRALPAVYSQADKFLAEQEKFQDNVMKLRTMVERGDQAILTQISNVDKDCRSCHKSFRAERKKK
jgi:cytochrome c556